MSTCKSCGARIIWAIVPETGKRMPVDDVPSSKGTIRLLVGSVTMAKPLSKAEAEACAGDELYTSHFATCPNAKQHRKG